MKPTEPSPEDWRELSKRLGMSPQAIRNLLQERMRQHEGSPFDALKREIDRAIEKKRKG